MYLFIYLYNAPYSTILTKYNNFPFYLFTNYYLLYLQFKSLQTKLTNAELITRNLVLIKLVFQCIRIKLLVFHPWIYADIKQKQIYAVARIAAGFILIKQSTQQTWALL